MALFTRTAKLVPGAHGTRCAGAMAVHDAVGITVLVVRETVVIGRAGQISWLKVCPLPIPPLALHTSL